MKTKQIVEGFLCSEFAGNNVYLHSQAGLPQPFLHKGGLGLRLWLHGLDCTQDAIVLSAPQYEIRFVYPTVRIVFFSEIEPDAFPVSRIVLPKKKVKSFKSLYERSFSASDEVLEFFDMHHKMTSVVLKEYYQCIDKNASETGMEQWYGGLYDHNSSV